MLAKRLRSTEALVLIRERTKITAPLLERLSALKLISQRSVFPHIDVEACTRLGIVVSSNLHPGTPSYATAELTWGLILAAMRRIPQQAEGLRNGRWQDGMGSHLRGKTWGFSVTGASGAWWRVMRRLSGWKYGVVARDSLARARADGYRWPAARPNSSNSAT